MEAKADIWYRLGYAWETVTRKIAPSALGRNRRDEAGGLVRRVVGGRADRSPVREDLPRAALAGAGAALAARSLGRLLARDAVSGDDPGFGIELARGAAEGLALAVVSRHLPSGRLLRIGVSGAARCAAAPWGGLPRVIRPIAPATIRTISSLAPGSGRNGGLLEHAAFAAAFVLLYGRKTSGSAERMRST